MAHADETQIVDLESHQFSSLLERLSKSDLGLFLHYDLDKLPGLATKHSVPSFYWRYVCRG